MKGRLLILNHALLLMCASMYLGTGVSLVYFSFPVASQFTPENYYLQFVPQIASATTFYTAVTKIMWALGLVMLIAEWRQPTRWVPIVVLVCVTAAGALTYFRIFPLNEEMAAGIKDGARLQALLQEWMQWSRVRFALWCAQWAALAWYFARWAYRSRYPWTR